MMTHFLPPLLLHARLIEKTCTSFKRYVLVLNNQNKVEQALCTPSFVHLPDLIHCLFEGVQLQSEQSALGILRLQMFTEHLKASGVLVAPPLSDQRLIQSFLHPAGRILEPFRFHLQDDGQCIILSKKPKLEVLSSSEPSPSLRPRSKR